MSAKSPKSVPPGAPGADVDAADGGSTALPQETERQAAEFDVLRRMLVVSRNTFSLSLAVCNSPALRDHLVAALSAADASVQAVVVPSETTDIFGYVQDHATGDGASALCIVGLEDSLPAGADDFPTLRSLNASRELWKQRFAIPVIFWLPEYAAGLLSIHAPDCWRWFSHQFEFVSELAGVEAGRSDQYAGDTLAAGRLDADQKRFRMAELQQRIDQAGPEPDPQIVSHVLLWLNELAFLHQFLGDLDRAEEMLRKSLEIGKKLGRLAGMAIDYGNLGLIHRKRGDLARAEEMHRKALEIDEKLGHLEGMANQYGNLGLVYQTRGDLDRAEEMYRKALEIDEKLARLEGMASGYGNLGLIHRIRGDLDRAEDMHRKSLAIHEKLGRLEGMAKQYGNLGLIYQRRGDLDRAEEMQRKSLEIDEKLGRLEGMAIGYGNLGSVQEARGDICGAHDLWSKARDLFEMVGMPHMVERVQGWIDDLPDTQNNE